MNSYTNKALEILKEISDPIWAEETKKLPGEILLGLQAVKEGRWNVGILDFLKHYRTDLNRLGTTIGFDTCKLCGDSYFWKHWEGLTYEKEGQVTKEGTIRHGILIACDQCFRVLDEETVKRLLAASHLTPDQQAIALENWQPKIRIQVNPLGSDDPEDFCSPWRTIKAAIEHSDPKAIIHLAPGDYPEDLLITRPVIFEAEEGVSIRSAIFPVEDLGCVQSVSKGSVQFTEESYPVMFQKFGCMQPGNAFGTLWFTKVK